MSTRRFLTLITLGAFLAAGILVAAPAQAMPLDRVVATIADSGGRYQPGGASLTGSDCSGLVSVAQALATGQPIRRLGNTHSLIAGRWPDVIPGATPADRFVIAANQGHMVAQLGGTRIEARQSGERYRIGPTAADPFGPKFPHKYHIDPRVLIA